MLLDMKEMPNNYLIEQQLIGCIMNDNELMYDLYITPDQIYNKKYASILRKIIDLWAKKSVIDLWTLNSEWIEQNDVIDCAMSIMTPRWFNDYQKEIKDLYIYRKLITLSSEVVTKSYDLKDMSSIVNLLKNQMDYCAWDNDNNDFITSVMNVLDRLWQQTNKICNYWLRSIDDMCNWYKEWQLIIIWARPKVGKTSMMMTMIDKCIDQWVRVWGYTLEMSQEEMAYRYVSKITKISVNWLQTITDEDKKKRVIDSVLLQTDKLQNIYIRDKIWEIDKIIFDIIREKKKNWLWVVFIDYLWLIKWFDTNKNQLKTYEIQDITNSLKRLAKELWIAIVLFVQISREAEKNSRPTAANLRDSWAIEQDADVVILLHRDLTDDMPYKQDKYSREIEVIVALQRNWPSWVLFMRYHLPSMTIYDE